MKQVLTIILTLFLVVGVLWVARAWTQRRLDERVATFNGEADKLIQGIQQYREFVGSYPTGNNATITKALLGQTGQTEKKVVILAVRNCNINDKGEIVDGWGTPLQFYFSHNEVMIRSAGPNRVWEDSAVPTGDDLYRCARNQK
jgi:hypothetical protein